MRWIVFACASVAAIAGCQSSSPSGATPPPVAIDGGGSPDAGPNDAGPAGKPFGARCLVNGECLSGSCISSGICSEACSTASDCPPGPEWSCGVASVCTCVRSGRDVCDGRDNDCNGIIDDGADACSDGQSCKAGACVCPAKNQCGAACFDLDTNKAHCGSCENVCDVDCGAGKCRVAAGVGAGQEFACARMSDGAVTCWGWNDYGQLGQESDTDCTTRKCLLAPKTVPGLAGVVEIGVGPAHACARLASGAIKCWGDDDVGELGLESPAQCGPRGCSVAPVAVPGITTATQLALGGAHTCALLADATVRCWGANDFGQLGYPTTTKCDLIPCSTSPGVVTGLSDVAELSSGVAHTCARTRGGQVYCWGANQYGQLGVSTTDACPSGKCSRTAVLVASLTGVASIAAGGAHTCARLTGDTLACWGANRVGQLGSVTAETCDGVACATAPAAVVALSGVADIALGAAHSCARLRDGSLSCWGSNESGALGYATAGTCGGIPCSAVPTSVPGVADVTTFSLGDSHTCASLRSGSAQCWGYNYFGQLGDGTRASRAVPKPVVW